MNRIRKILIPTDFSPCAQNALQYVMKMASQDDTLSLVILHVSKQEPDTAQDEAITQQLGRIREQLSFGLKPRTEFIREVGPLVETILNEQQTRQVDMIVMGTLGREEGQKEPESQTSRLVLEADCPVLVVPDEAVTFQIKHIALALDQNEIDDLKTLGVLHDIARWFGAQVHVLTINTQKEEIMIGAHKNRSNLEYYLETLDYHYAFPESSDIEQGITQYLEEHNIDMLAILPNTHAQKAQPSEGRLTKLLTLHTKVPLLAID